jgi:hypothetical protein
MPRQRLVAGLFVVGAVAVCCWRTAAPVPAEPPAGEAAPSPTKPVGALLGVAGCTPAGCHNGNAEGKVKGSEYGVWINRDRHARAYEVLFEPRSRQMVTDRYGPEAKSPSETALCLKCHAADPALPHGPGFSIADGVGCESCHGPAEKWREEHYRWPKDKPLAEKLALGMRDTKDLAERVQLCVSCHVGSGAAEVNHDLIAAGHPRLNFEFSAFLAAYPTHWESAGEPEAAADFHARAWAVGQLVSARAALKLLEVRAAAADRAQKAERPEGSSPWPEFAEYNCAACHQALASELRRTEASSRGRRLGTLPWGSWYVSLVEAYAAESPAEEVRALPKGPLAALRELMEQPNPDPARVAQAAAKVSKALDAWFETIKGQSFSGPDARKLLAGFLAQGEAQADGMSFDEAAQLYLAVAALHGSLTEMKVAPADAAGLGGGIQALKDQLRDALPKGSDSPVQFDPLREPSLQGRLRAMRRALGE